MPVYIGIDWSENKHDVCVLNEAGAFIAKATIAHSAPGFQKLETLRQQLGVAPQDCLVALETAHNLIIDFLWGHGYSQVYVIPPNVIKSSRGRHRHSGAYNDQSDAFVIADVARTDQARLQPWHPDSLRLQQLRAQLSSHVYLSHSCVRVQNRLRAILLRFYPAAPHVFSQLDTHIALQFLQAYPTPAAARALSVADFTAFARSHGYRHPKQLAGCYARLHGNYPEAAPGIETLYADEVVQLASSLLQLVRTKEAGVRRLQQLFQQHPDSPIFDSLPGVGEILGPGLLVKFGDDRKRFPTAASVQALAGTCPVTEESGKKRVVKFRRSCDHEFRSLVHSWALASVSKSVWAQAYWQQIRPRCDSNTHAYRCLANRWLAIAWKLWQSNERYDEAYHLQERAKRSKPRS